MRIEWNRVTWYSKLVAVVVFLLTAGVFFELGAIYGKSTADVSLSPAQFSSMDKNPGSKIISQDDALQIAANIFGSTERTSDASFYRISAVLHDDGWHVIYENKSPEPTTNGGVSSGFVYIIDKFNGSLIREEPIVINPSL